MKQFQSIILIVAVLITTQSCNRKKLEEVVEVPLPTAEEKMIIGMPDDVNADDGQFKLIKLPYDYAALSPNIDVLTLEIHYSKHYLTYTNNLNRAVAADEKLADLSIEEILAKLDITNLDLKNNAGGYYNHGLYWESMASKSGGQPKDTLAGAIDRDFGSFEIFKNQFIDASENQFGSGWAWLLVDKAGKLQITTTSNQDNPLMPKQPIQGKPILALDLWEHAYYLDYQYKRKKYIDAFFKVINWKKIEERFEESIVKK